MMLRPTMKPQQFEDILIRLSKAHSIREKLEINAQQYDMIEYTGFCSSAITECCVIITMLCLNDDTPEVKGILDNVYVAMSRLYLILHISQKESRPIGFESKT